MSKKQRLFCCSVNMFMTRFLQCLQNKIQNLKPAQIKREKGIWEKLQCRRSICVKGASEYIIHTIQRKRSSCKGWGRGAWEVRRNQPLKKVMNWTERDLSGEKESAKFTRLKMMSIFKRCLIIKGRWKVCVWLLNLTLVQLGSSTPQPLFCQQ